ncbi:MAG: dihydropteroate synthase [Synergistaceae bacterium]|nr:dihydropteroate synthase [Synergistaceae bacterium]
MSSPAGHTITLSLHTKLMGILNVTPDSFFPESRVDEAGILTRAEAMLEEGAYILDVGAESTRPGAEPVSADEELGRLLPALRALRKNFPDAIISVDTYKPEVARAAVSEGADIINDVMFSAEMAEAVSEVNVPYVLSYYGRDDDMPGGMVRDLGGKLAVLEGAGVKREQVIVDPGLGFGKSATDNFAVLKDIESLRVWGCPVLVGHSRKRFTGTERLAGTLAVSALMAGRVSLLRVHDVKENAAALRIAEGVSGARERA